MKKITIRFEELFCDFCSYDIQIVLNKYSEITDFKIHRNINVLEIHFEKNKEFQLEGLVNDFNKEGLKVVEVIRG